MGNKTKIEWTDASWTPIRAKLRNKPYPLGWHCEHASEGCRYCYAESINKRLGTGLDFKPGHRPSIELFLDEKMLMLPLRWWRQPRGIFVCSMTDLFADFVRDEWIDALFAVMMICPQHTFQVLTKRMARARAYCSDPATVKRISDKVCDMALMRGVDAVLIAPGMDPELAPKGARVFLGRWPLPNVWLGVSCEDQENADARIPELLATPAAVRFVSAEPLLGPIDFTQINDGEAHREVLHKEWGIVDDDDSPPGLWWNALTGERTIMHGGATGEWSRTDASLDWIIAGGESGPKARPMHPDWARSIRDQCVDAGVAFFFKQFGEWAPAPDGTYSSDGRTFKPDIADGDIWMRSDGLVGDGKGDRSRPPRIWKPSEMAVLRRVGKKAAGRLLDGREHNEMPRPAP